MLRPSNSISPPAMSTSRSSDLPVVDLPHPDSPTSASVSSGIDIEADLLHRMHAAGDPAEEPGANIEAGGQFLHLQQRLGAVWRRALARSVAPAPPGSSLAPISGNLAGRSVPCIAPSRGTAASNACV